MDKEYREIIASSVNTLPGIGVKRAEAFKKLGIYTLGDLAEHFPRAYQNRGNVHLLSDAAANENRSYILVIGTQPRSAVLKGRITVTKFNAFDSSGSVNITYFNSRFVESVFHVGEVYRFWGKVSHEKGYTVMTSPIYEKVYENAELPDFTPIYPSGTGLTQGIISQSVKTVLDRLSSSGVPELVPERVRTGMSLPSRADAYRMIHFPRNLEEIEKARLAFTAGELYVFALGISAMRKRKVSGKPPVMSDIPYETFERFKKLLGFKLTGAQERSIEEIRRDMVGAEVPMSRLLSGDVGSGKTAVAAAAIMVALSSGYQAALMAPTEILASQHFSDLSVIMGEFGYRTELLVGSCTVSEKRRIRDAVANGEVDLIIGTHSLITPDTAYKRLGLVITDEQHRFGVRQRAELGRENNGENEPHVLVMSATPIPRTLALILYGDLSMSVLDEMPAGRQRVDTYTVDEGYRARLNGFIRKQVSEGGQVYIVCPAVEEKADGDEALFDGGETLTFDCCGQAQFSSQKKAQIKSAVERCEELKNSVFPDLRIGLLHGRMKGNEKDEVMKCFAAGEIDILVSTTVIEVGVNVPNASLMIVENAERFGLSQLHQLRGRVGRGRRKAYCILVSSGGGEIAGKRLSVMKNVYDGFKIAEYDLRLRGPGDYFPPGNGRTRQHGSFGCMQTADMDLLKKMMSEAEETLKNDPTLSLPENAYAAEYLNKRFTADGRAMQ